MNEVGYNLLMAKIRDLSAQTSFLFTGDDFSVEQDDSVQSGYKGTPEQILKSVFGYDSFRPLQRTVIQNVLDGRDTLAVMPTGGGKSLCYQIPALLSEGLTVVISPLIALMQDQVTQLESFGIAAAFINSSLEWNEYTAVCDRIRRGQIKPWHTWFIHICHLMTHVEIQEYVEDAMADYPALCEIVKNGGSVGPAYDGLVLES